ncbi:hypothetical protein [Butyrivibrio sp. YAB3001]|uniref:hypothetical protein n=1 Tax=Butyrivibrio sp. YAB3001 TaxID=1520812 RepID=UPI0008F66735|nr:hypothetical protein [Butyrivibrio sp. YAB3001]SFB82251.1 hypothetical protein SAMN02910398_00749 [Butyrivibrio sp. YAB3001]
MGIKIKKQYIFKKIRWPWANRKYKDTVFRLLFKNDKKALLDLYNALNGSQYNDPDALIINTLDNAIFMGMHNDLSFIIDTHLNIYEHQSTICPNIPLRCLFYVSNLYLQLIDEDRIYGKSLLKIPAPHFVVFYNGTDEMPETKRYILSDMYEDKSTPPELELTVKVFNINQGMNTSLMHSCKKLNEYSIFVSKVREYSETYTLTRAVSKAIDYCIANDILKDFLIRERKAVTMYSLYEYNKAGHMKVLKEEAFSEGVEHGKTIGKKNGISAERSRIITSMAKNGETPDKIAKLCDCSLDEVLAVLNRS